MGAGYSRGNEILSNKLFTLKQGIDARITDFEERYLKDPESFCNSLSLIDESSFKHYTVPQLESAAIALAVKVPDNGRKADLCKTLLRHFRRKRDMMTEISRTLLDLHSQLGRVINGPYCSGQPEISQKECVNKGGKWMFERKDFDVNAKENRPWILAVTRYEKAFTSYLKQLHTVLIDLADDSSTSTDVDLDRYQTLIESAKLDLQSCFQRLLVASAETKLWTEQELVEEKAKLKMLKESRIDENNKIREAYHKILQANKRLIQAHYKVPMAPDISAISKVLQPR